MKDRSYFLNTALAVVVTIALLAVVIVRTFAPWLVIPRLNIPNIVLLSLAALVVDHYAAPGVKRCYICIPVFSAVTFGLLPLAAGLVPAQESLKLALIGGAVFTVVTLLFSSIQERLSSGPAAKAAPVLSAFGLYLAAQCLTGILL